MVKRSIFKYFEELFDLFKKQFYKYLRSNLDVAGKLIKRFEELKKK